MFWECMLSTLLRSCELTDLSIRERAVSNLREQLVVAFKEHQITHLMQHYIMSVTLSSDFWLSMMRAALCLKAESMLLTIMVCMLSHRGMYKTLCA